MRVIVTGSRNWDKPIVIRSILNQLYLRGGQGAFVVVHGDCPTGADAITKEWHEDAKRDGKNVIEKPHPAEWERYGKLAGPRRNKTMVAKGADACVAFPLPGSRGTRNCISLARKAGIPTFVVEYDKC